MPLDPTQAWPPVNKDVASLPVRPNLLDYPEACRSFTWERARQGISGLPGGGLNIAHEAVDRHATAAEGTRSPWSGWVGTAAAAS